MTKPVAASVSGPGGHGPLVHTRLREPASRLGPAHYPSAAKAAA